MFRGWVVNSHPKGFLQGSSKYGYGILFVVFLWVLSPAEIGYTQEQLTIRSIVLESDAEIPELPLDAILPVHSGSLVNDEALDRSIRLIYATGYCEQVGVKTRVQGNSVDLIFLCKVRPWIEKISFKFPGKRSFSPRRLIRLLTDYHPGFFLDYTSIRSWQQNIQNYYAEEGFSGTRVDFQVKEIHPRRKGVELHFMIHEGKPQIIRNVEWQGDKPCGALGVKILKLFKPGGRLSQSKRQRLFRTVQDFREKGYPLAHVGIVEHRKDGVVVLSGSCGPRVIISVHGWPGKHPPIIDPTIYFTGIQEWDEAPLRRMEQDLRETLKNEGYADATVRVVLAKPSNPAVKFLEVFITPGERMFLGYLVITGLGPSNIHIPYPIPGEQPWVPERFALWVNNLEETLRRNGFVSPQCKTITDESKGNAVGVRVDCQLPIQLHFGELRFFGNLALDDKTLEKATGIQHGKPFREESVRIGEDRIRQWYWQNGYFKVQVESRVMPIPDTGKVNVYYHILEGEQTHLGKVVFHGLRKTRPDFLYKWLKLREDGLLRPDLLQTFQEKLYDLSLFTRVEMPMPPPQYIKPREDIVVYVHEADSVHVNYGIGYQERDKVRGILTITNQNIAGRGYQAFGLLRFSFANRRVLGSFGNRMLFSLPLEWRLSSEYEFQDRVSFDSTRYRAVLQMFQRFGPKHSLTGQVEVSQTRVSNIELINPDEITQLAREFENLSLTTLNIGYIEDTRDSIIDATRGHFMTLNGELGLRIWGADYDFIKLAGQISGYRTVTKSWIMAGAVRMGWSRRLYVNPLIPALSQRFYAGGSRSHRGFSIDGLGPRDPVSGAPTGGNSFWIVSLEQRFRPLTRWGLVGFLDIGNVFLKDPSFRWTAIRKAGGFGLRYESPVGLVGVDFAWLLDPRPGEKSFHWFVTVGQDF